MEQPEPVSVPLFPLGTVLFPGVPLPLHIFEERYRLMIGECLEQERAFGVALIKQGKEVGGPATPFDVGTMARITHSLRREDGRMDIVAVGARRFRLIETLQSRPYLQGKVQYLDEPPGDDPDRRAEQVREEFVRHVRLASGLRNEWVRGLDLPDDAIALSYTIAYLLKAPPSFKQMLLEAPDARSRLDHELRLLQQLDKQLRRRLEGQSPFFGPALN